MVKIIKKYMAFEIIFILFHFFLKKALTNIKTNIIL